MKRSNPIHIDPDILGGIPVFKGTRVPVESLFWHLAQGIAIEEFLDDFPSVTRDQVMEAMKMASKIFSSPNILALYENIT